MRVEEHKQDDDDLHDRLPDHVEAHLRGNDGRRAVDGGAPEDGGVRRLGRKGKGCERIHDKVDPEHLDCRDRAFVIKNCSDNCARQRSDVHGQLELQKFRYAVVNLTRTLGAPKKPNLCSYLTSIINSTWSHAKDHNLQVNGRPYLIT